jgi:hypothetical protein
MFVSYDLEERTRGRGTALYPKVQRVYIAGAVKNWMVGSVRKRSGRQVHGVRIEYEQTRVRYRRKGYEAERGGIAHHVAPASVGATSEGYVQIVELPARAQNVRSYTDRGQLPANYLHALQRVR